MQKGLPCQDESRRVIQLVAALIERKNLEIGWFFYGVYGFGDGFVKGHLFKVDG